MQSFSWDTPDRGETATAAAAGNAADFEDVESGEYEGMSAHDAEIEFVDMLLDIKNHGKSYQPATSASCATSPRRVAVGKTGEQTCKQVEKNTVCQIICLMFSIKTSKMHPHNSRGDAWIASPDNRCSCNDTSLLKNERSDFSQL